MAGMEAFRLSVGRPAVKTAENTLWGSPFRLQPPFRRPADSQSKPIVSVTGNSRQTKVSPTRLAWTR